MSAAPFERLLQPLQLGGVRLANRIVSTAHGVRLAAEHAPSERDIAYYLAKAHGGVGMIVQEALRVHPTTVPSPASIVGYDLTDVSSGSPVSSIIDILSIRYKVPYPIGKWVPVMPGAWELTPSSDTTAFPSGYSLTLHTDAYPGLPVRITYAAPFGQLVNLTDDVTTVAGLPLTAVDLPPLGAMISLVSPREVRRNQIDSEPDSRRAPEVPPGAVMNSVAGVLRQRQSRINAEAGRLQALYGFQRGVL